MKSFAFVTGILAGLLFGIATPFSKLLLAELNSFQLAGLLYLGATLTFLPYVIKNYKREFNTIRQSRQKSSILGIIIFGGLLGPVFLLFGLKSASSSSVSVWLNLELVSTAVIGVIFFKDHLDKPAVLGVIFALTAGVTVSFQEGFGAVIPGIFVGLACICWGIDNHLTALIDGASPQTITFLKGIFAGSINLFIGMLIGGADIAVDILLLSLVVGTISYGFSIVLYVISAQHLGATRSQVLFSTGSFWGILAAFLLLAEPINIYVVISILLLALGIFWSNILIHTHSHKHKKISHVHLHTHDEHHTHSHDQEVNDLPHTHLHDHNEQIHTHKHFPDLHHRHDH
ncbi:MAG: DMT family transporter [Candidatus Cloacimonetes bacterium]|nr:DMT family transporter [Candidatus Cloacimonadota bacterium]